MSTEVKNGQPDSEEITLTLELTLDEAEALKAWLLKPAADGSAAIDDAVREVGDGAAGVHSSTTSVV